MNPSFLKATGQVAGIAFITSRFRSLDSFQGTNRPVVRFYIHARVDHFSAIFYRFSKINAASILQKNCEK